MEHNFAEALKKILRYEGGYVDHPADPGGATNKGITLRTFRRACGRTRTKDDLRNISPGAVARIYRKRYWEVCACDRLPTGIDLIVFDQAVNSGPGRSARWLQKVLGATQDGKIGPRTLRAAARARASDVVTSMCEERLDFLKRARQGTLWPVFGRGGLLASAPSEKQL